MAAFTLIEGLWRQPHFANTIFPPVPHLCQLRLLSHVSFRILTIFYSVYNAVEHKIQNNVGRVAVRKYLEAGTSFSIRVDLSTPL